MKEYPESMYCSYGDHESDEYVWHSSDGSFSICKQCAERIYKQKKVIDKAMKDLEWEQKTTAE